MRKYCLVLSLMLLQIAGVWLYRDSLLADPSLPQNVTITQVKISGEEFVVLRNNTDLDVQLSNYWLQYYNESSLAVGVSNSSAQLPDAKLPAHGEIILSTGLAPVCGQLLVAKLPFALKDSAGLLQVVAIAQTGAVIGYQPQDQVSWSNAKTSNSADLKLPSSQDSKQVWFRVSPQAEWQSGLVDYNSACQPGSSGTPGSSGNTATLGDSTGSPPYVTSSGGSESSGNGIPAADAGLAPPQISELLPNPAPPQTDANDEFIELYNPNDKAFDLSGFILQTGTSSSHDYTFPDGTLLEPKSFEAFFITKTKLTLSNSEGQAKLLDPTGKTLIQSDIYTSAKDGQAWVFAAGKWQWTTKSTPGASNEIIAPADKKSGQSSTTAVRASTNSSSNGGSNQAAGSGSGRSVNALILVGVALAALLYAGYEYRHDVANALYKFRRNRTVRGGAGPVVESTRGS
jgi:hypothetical protein